jgi:hypothetical protein
MHGVIVAFLGVLLGGGWGWDGMVIPSWLDKISSEGISLD